MITDDSTRTSGGVRDDGILKAESHRVFAVVRSNTVLSIPERAEQSSRIFVARIDFNVKAVCDTASCADSRHGYVKTLWIRTNGGLVDVVLKVSRGSASGEAVVSVQRNCAIIGNGEAWSAGGPGIALELISNDTTRTATSISNDCVFNAKGRCVVAVVRSHTILACVVLAPPSYGDC